MAYEEELESLKTVAQSLKTRVVNFRGDLQNQFLKEFADGSRSHNRGLLYAQCGTNCQAMEQMLTAIVTDLELIDDLPLIPKDKVDEQGEPIGIIEEVQVF